MRKSRYRYKRYLLYLPIAIGDQLDLSLNYSVRLFGGVVVLVPEGTVFPLTRLEKPEIANRENTNAQGGSLTRPFLKGSRTTPGSELK